MFFVSFHALLSNKRRNYDGIIRSFPLFNVEVIVGEDRV